MHLLDASALVSTLRAFKRRSLCLLGWHCWHQAKRHKDDAPTSDPFGKVKCCRCAATVERRVLCLRIPKGGVHGRLAYPPMPKPFPDPPPPARPDLPLLDQQEPAVGERAVIVTDLDTREPQTIVLRTHEAPTPN